MKTLALLPLLLPACATGSYLWYRVAPDHPVVEDDTFTVVGLSAPVTVYLDELGVAHIDAQSEVDLHRAFGFVHGRDRFFQMDLMRRVARGRLSELVGEQPFFGKTTVDFDRSMVGWGIGEAAAEDAGSLSASRGALVTAYVAGVNAALAEWLPIEYRLLRVEPEPWAVVDVFALGRLNAWSVSHNWHQEASRLLFALHGGAERSDAIYPGEPWIGPASLPADAEASALPPSIAPELRAMFVGRRPPPASDRDQRLGGPPDLGGASNGWVVGGDASASGKPVVGNDPHLALTLPAVMAQVHLRAPGVDVIGVAIPGVPAVLAGHNRRVAWTTTSAVGDVIDLFVEQAGDAPGTVLGPDGPYPLESREVTVRVRVDGELEERRFTMRRSRHGPLFNDMYPGVLPAWAPPVAVQWASGDSADSLAAVDAAARAETAEQCADAMAGMASPVAVWMAADVDGGLAFVVNGDLPVRHHHRGTFPAPGWLAQYDWDGLTDGSRSLRAAGGNRDRFVHANNLVRPPTESRARLNVDSAPAYRFERIDQLLANNADHGLESFRAIQNDLWVARGRILTPPMLADLEALAGSSPVEAKARELLAGWDFVAAADSAATAVFFSTYREAAVLALEDELDAGGLAFVLAQRYTTNAIDLWFADPGHPVWDNRRTPEHEDRAAVVRPACRAAVAWLARELGPDPSGWRWGDLRPYRLEHPFGGREALAELFNLPARSAGGGPDSVWKSHFDFGNAARPFRPVAGPIVRTVVDLADIEHGRWVSSTGASGWPGSPHYGDQFEAWARGELLPMVSNWHEIRRDAAAVLTLEPPGE